MSVDKIEKQKAMGHLNSDSKTKLPLNLIIGNEAHKKELKYVQTLQQSKVVASKDKPKQSS